MPTDPPPKRQKDKDRDKRAMRRLDAASFAALGVIFFFFTVLFDTGASEKGLELYRFFTFSLVGLGVATIFVSPE